MTEITPRSVSVSIVSHAQGGMVAELLRDLDRCAGINQVFLTLNVPEPEIGCPESLHSRLVTIRNEHPKGFAANHNQAFQRCTAPFFAVLNPDIRLGEDPFSVLMDALVVGHGALVAPAVRNPDGLAEDSARYFPTPLRLLAKLFGLDDGRCPVDGMKPMCVDWVAGMFMLFRADAFRVINGFDEGFFLYYEDVDICARLWKNKLGVLLHPGMSVVHAAQRASRRRPRYLAWHLTSLVRYFRKHLGRLPQRCMGERGAG